MKKRIFCLLLSFAVLLCFGTACDMKAPDAASSDTAPEVAAEAGASEPGEGAAGDPFHISFMTTEFVNAPTSMEQLTWKTMGETLGIYLDFELISGTAEEYNEVLNLRLTSGDLPDLFYAPISVVAKYYTQGVVRQLDELLESNGRNVLAAIEEAGITKNSRADDGHFYAVPLIEESSTMECGGWINKRWMDACGITEVPTTTDELYDVLVKFKETMPEGTIPLTRGPWYELADQFFRYFGTYHHRNWVMYNEDDGYVYGPYYYKEEMRDALTYLHKLYDEKLLDQEYIDRDDESLRALSINDETGFFITWSDHAPAVCAGGSDGTDYIPVPPLKAPNGNCYTGIKPAKGMSFSISGKASDETAEKVMEMLDYIYGPEGETLFCWGVEGETYTIVDGEPQFVDAIMNHEIGALNGRRTFGIEPVTAPHIATWEGWAAVLTPECVAQVEMGLPYIMPQQPELVGTEEEETELANIMADVEKYTKDSLAQFITGGRPMSEFDQFIADLEGMNIQRAHEINAAKFQRWMDR